jgi:Phage tail assembly chaperone proteins, E, or 41 or 14
MADENPNFELRDDAAPGAPAPDVEMNGAAPEIDPLSYALTKPIQAHGQEIRVLKWREPTAGDIERAGNPIVVDLFGEQPRLTFDERKMNQMISTLAQIPPSSVRMLSGSDWNTIAWKLVRFFMPALGA